MKKDKPINPDDCKNCELFKQDLCTGYHPCGELMTNEDCQEMKEMNEVLA